MTTFHCTDIIPKSTRQTIVIATEEVTPMIAGARPKPTTDRPAARPGPTTPTQRGVTTPAISPPTAKDATSQP